MIFAERYKARRFNEGREEGLQVGRQEGLQEGREEGRQEGRQNADAEWVAWLQDLREAQAKGEDFDEPPPSDKRSKP